MDPSETARRIFAAQADGRWDDAAALVDRASGEGFKEWVIEHATKTARQRSEWLEDPEISPKFKESLRNEQPWYERVYGANAVEVLKRMPTVELVSRFAENDDPHVQYASYDEHTKEKVGRLRVTRTVLGHVFESEEIAHVVYRREWQQGTTGFQLVEVLTLVNSPEGWRAKGIGHLQNFWHQYPPS